MLVTTLDNPVTAPAWIFTADLEKEPDTGKLLVESPNNVGNTLPDEFLVGVEPLSCFSGHRLGNRNCFHESEKRDDSRYRDQLEQDIQIQPWNPETWQSARNSSDNASPAHQNDRLFIDGRMCRPLTSRSNRPLLPFHQVCRREDKSFCPAASVAAVKR